MRMWDSAETKANGFTLIELIVALAVLVLAAAAFVPAFTFVAEANQQNKLKMTASTIAASVLEEIRAVPYEEIGTRGGNPAGDIDQKKDITVGGVRYTVETAITWGDVTKPVDGSPVENPVAYKNIHVVVRAPGAFSGKLEKLDEIYSIASRESEETVVKDGHIRVTVKEPDGKPYTEASFEVNIVSEAPTPALNQTLSTDNTGMALFGLIKAGNYTVKVRIPENISAKPGQTVEEGWLVKRNVQVTGSIIAEAEFCMEADSKLGSMTVRLADADTGNTVTVDGRLTLGAKSGEVNINAVDDKKFTQVDFIGGELPPAFFGALWPGMAYSLSIQDMSGYANYDMELETAIKPLLPDNSEWDGTMPSPVRQLKLTVKVRAGSAHFYKEDTKEDFDNAAQLQSITAIGDGGGFLQLASGDVLEDLAGKMNVQASSSSSSHPASSSSDDDSNSYWQYGSSVNLPQWLQWDLGASANVGRLNILAKQFRTSGGSTYSRVPKNFKLQYSDDSVRWNDLIDGVLINNTSDWQAFNIPSPKAARYYRLYMTSKYDSDRAVAINEVELLQAAKKYSTGGTRVSKGIPLNKFTSAPVFKIRWSAAATGPTSVGVYTAVSTGASMPSADKFKQVANGGILPDITKGASLSGKYLWVMEKLGTTDTTKTPALDWLYIDY